MDQDTSNQGVERERLRLENTKFRSETSHNRRVLWVGAFVSVVIVIIPATSSYLNESARLTLEAQRQEADLQHRTDDLKLKQSEVQNSRDATRVKFLQDHIDMIMSDQPEADLKLAALAKLALPADADVLIAQVRTIRRELALQRSSTHKEDEVSATKQATLEEEGSVPPLIVSPGEVSALEDRQLAPGMAQGKAYVRQGDYEHALQNFNAAVAHNPDDALAWNFKAYSEFRTNRFNPALTSISRAWKLNPSENKTRRWIAINATKILCAQGRSNEAATFFNQSSAVVPEIVADVYGDGEFKSTCQAIWQG